MIRILIVDDEKPILNLIRISLKNAVNDRVKGLRMGAEDYVVKPFEIAELLARVEVVLRRYCKTEKIFRLKGLIVNCASMKVEREGKESVLTPKEFDLLCLFLRMPNIALYREQIYERVWVTKLLQKIGTKLYQFVQEYRCFIEQNTLCIE